MECNAQKQQNTLPRLKLARPGRRSTRFWRLGRGSSPIKNDEILRLAEEVHQAAEPADIRRLAVRDNCNNPSGRATLFAWKRRAYGLSKQ